MEDFCNPVNQKETNRVMNDDQVEEGFILGGKKVKEGKRRRRRRKNKTHDCGQISEEGERWG